jgi:hypothetical protein
LDIRYGDLVLVPISETIKEVAKWYP